MHWPQPQVRRLGQLALQVPLEPTLSVQLLGLVLPQFQQQAQRLPMHLLQPQLREPERSSLA
jgi:hypothetical protein